MENVIVEVFAVDMAKAVGFRPIEPTGPAGIRFGLYLPSKEENLTTYGQLAEILETKVIDNILFPWKIGYIHINYGDYKKISSIVLSQYLQDFPLSKDCRINTPASLIFGEGL